MNRSTMASLVRDFGPPPQREPLCAPASARITVLPVIAPAGFWLPPWQDWQGLRIPAPPMPELPGPGGSVSIKPDNLERYLERPSGLWEPLPLLRLRLEWMDMLASPGPLRSEGSISIRYEDGDCPCPYCEGRRLARSEVDDVRPAPVYDHAPLERGGIDNDFDPEWGTRTSSEGPGLLLEELLDDSTKAFLAKRDASRQTRHRPPTQH